MEPGDADPLAAETRAAQEALEQTVADACDTKPATEADTGDLIRLEELLSSANEAAKRAISLRRRQRVDRESRKAARAALADVEAEVGGDATHRIFRDARGKRWDVFAVHPEPEIVERTQLRGTYSQGWLCFDAGQEKRRLSPIPADWFNLTNEQLAELAEGAEVATRKRSP